MKYIPTLILFFFITMVGCTLFQREVAAPSSSMTKLEAVIFAKTWVRHDKIHRDFLPGGRGTSMLPWLDYKTVLLLEKVELERLRVGDLIAYYTRSGRICHPITAIDVTAMGVKSFLTSGFNNRYPDEWVHPNQDIWRVAGILYTND